VAVWYSLWSFGIFSPILVCFDQEESGNPDSDDRRRTGTEERTLPIRVTGVDVLNAILCDFRQFLAGKNWRFFLNVMNMFLHKRNFSPNFLAKIFFKS
jgi:hypothetical protein